MPALPATRFGQLPGAYFKSDSEQYLKSYVGVYLREEIQIEAQVRNLGLFSRFLEAASMFFFGNVLYGISPAVGLFVLGGIGSLGFNAVISYTLQPFNVSQFRTSGLDLNLNYRRNTGVGLFRPITLNWFFGKSCAIAPDTIAPASPTPKQTPRSMCDPLRVNPCK